MTLHPLKKNVSIAFSVCFWVLYSVPWVTLSAFMPAPGCVCHYNSAAFPIKSATRQGCLLPVLFFTIVLRVLTREIKQEKDRKDIKTTKGLKIPLFADDMVLYLKECAYCTGKLLALVNTFNKVSGCN